MSDPWSGAREKERAHERFHHTGREPTDAEIREAILASWQRSKSLGVDQRRLRIPAETDLDPDTRLRRAAAPALRELADRLHGLPVAILLTDAEARIVDHAGDGHRLEQTDDSGLIIGASCAERHIGTNSISMALSTRSPFVVIGQEHYFHEFQVLACIAAPIKDPVGGEVEGVVNISFPREEAEPGLALTLERTVRQIEHRLLELSTARERGLAQRFTTARARLGSTLLDVDGEAGVPTPTDSLLRELPPGDQALLLARATELIADEATTHVRVPLARGRGALLRRRIIHYGDAVGAGVEVCLLGPPGLEGLAGPAATGTSGAGPWPPSGQPGAARPTALVPAPAAAPLPLLAGDPSVGHLAVAARRRLALLNEASDRIGGSLDLARTTREFADVVVPRFADVVALDLLAGIPEGEEPATGPLPPDVPLVRSVLGTAAGSARPAPGPEPFSHPASSPQTRCMRQDRTVREPVLGVAASSERAGPATEPLVHLGPGEHSLIAVPLRARGSVLGVATFYRDGRNGAFEDDDLYLAEVLARRTAVCLDNARRYSRERAVSLTLQRSLLPRDTPELSAVEVSSRYLPASQTADVGGDWYDVVPLSGSRVALVIGDVAGQGLHAAATMGRLRAAVRTLAGLDLPPEEILDHLDALVNESRTGQSGDDPALGASCLYVVYDPVTARCTAARAGSPQPVVVTPGGAVHLFDLPVGGPLGHGGGLPYAPAETTLAEGSVLALCTGDEGEAGPGHGRSGIVMRALRDAGPSLPAMCDRVVEALDVTHAEDDTTVLLARTRVLPRDHVAQWALDPDPANVRRARAHVEEQLADWDLAGLAGNTELLASELVTNAIRYAGDGSPIGLRLIRDRTLICEVSDHSNSSPRIRRAGTGEEGGRGLYLVAQFSTSWGARYTSEGKTVWAEQPLHSATVPADPGDEALLSLYDEP